MQKNRKLSFPELMFGDLDNDQLFSFHRHWATERYSQ